MLYHYTSKSALESILRESPSDQGICFWATRFDCFGDHEEYKLGIETIQRLLPQIEARLQPDRRVAHLFDWNEINGNKNMFWPYVISFTSKYDNPFMWDNYGEHGKGIVLALDDSKTIQVKDMPTLTTRSCIYKGKVSEDCLAKEIESEYFNGAFSMLGGPRKEVAFAFLISYPQIFVRLIALYLLTCVAPRIKEGKYHQEEEIRAIMASPLPNLETLFQPSISFAKSLNFDTDPLLKMMANEKSRKRANGDVVFYKELFLPSSLLTKVYVKDDSLVENIQSILHNKGFGCVEVITI